MDRWIERSRQGIGSGSGCSICYAILYTESVRKKKTSASFAQPRPPPVPYIHIVFISAHICKLGV